MIEEDQHPNDFMECPRCAEHIRRRATVCRFCGHELTGSPSAPSPEPPPDPAAKWAPKSAGTALLLALLLPGLGHVYVGKVGTGFVLLVVAVILANATVNGSEPGVAGTLLGVFQVTQVVLAFRAARS